MFRVRELPPAVSPPGEPQEAESAGTEEQQRGGLGDALRLGDNPNPVARLCDTVTERDRVPRDEVAIVRLQATIRERGWIDGPQRPQECAACRLERPPVVGHDAEDDPVEGPRLCVRSK